VNHPPVIAPVIAVVSAIAVVFVAFLFVGGGGRRIALAATVTGCDHYVTGAAIRAASGSPGVVDGGVLEAGQGGCAEDPEPTPKPKPKPKPEPAPAPEPAPEDGVWDRLAQCESSGNWAIDTGNGYSGVIRTDDDGSEADHCSSVVAALVSAIRKDINANLISRLGSPLAWRTRS
jgi:hypothetical protein